jgi:hypothetical protein
MKRVPTLGRTTATKATYRWNAFPDSMLVFVYRTGERTPPLAEKSAGRSHHPIAGGMSVCLYVSVCICPWPPLPPKALCHSAHLRYKSNVYPPGCELQTKKVSLYIRELQGCAKGRKIWQHLIIFVSSSKAINFPFCSNRYIFILKSHIIRSNTSSRDNFRFLRVRAAFLIFLCRVLENGFGLSLVVRWRHLLTISQINY